MERTVIITANGTGGRMKGVSPLPKYELFYRGKRIIDHLIDRFPIAKILTSNNIKGHEDRIIQCKPTKTRRDTIANLKDFRNVLIVDSDIFVNEPGKFTEVDTIYKCNGRNAGVYFIESINDLLETMVDDDILPYTFIEELCSTTHLGTPEEYFKALGI